MNNFVKKLRKNSTLPEKILWHHLRNRSFLGYKFRRQVQIDNYIVDFLCYEARLIIELDGRQHIDKQAIVKDEIRTEYLMSQEFKVLRFYNTDILNNIDLVLRRLKMELEKPLTRPSDTLSRKGRGDEAISSKDINECSTSRKGRGENKRNQSLLPRREKVAESLMRVFMSKQELRQWAKDERKKLDVNALSLKLVCKLKKTKEYKQAKNIMLFCPKENEINLLSLLEDSSKTFYLPKIDNNNLLCCPYNLNDELCLSCFKTEEPKTHPVEKSLIDLIIVPALAVDGNNYRLGYGGGYYDRFLSDISGVKIVCVPKEFILETVFPEQHDIKIDKIISI